MFVMHRKTFLILLLSIAANCFAISKEAKENGFVYLSDIDPSIKISMRYTTNENFVGQPIQGYKKPVLMMTKQTAQALKKVQTAVKKDGYCLVVYDAYRPQQAVDHFYKWSNDISNQLRKQQYYPCLDKNQIFEKVYIMKRSSHSRGSTVDLTLIKDGKNIQKIKPQKRTLLDGCKIQFLNDGTVDMGSHFDLFHEASHHENNIIKNKYKKMRKYLKNIMEKFGFESYSKEWWHYKLKNEPYPADKDSSYFNFPIE